MGTILQTTLFHRLIESRDLCAYVQTVWGQEGSYNKVRILVIRNNGACYRFLISSASDLAYKCGNLLKIRKCYDAHTVLNGIKPCLAATKGFI